jgi:hypothetical protein
MQGASSRAVYTNVLSQAAFDCIQWDSFELYILVGFNKGHLEKSVFALEQA